MTAETITEETAVIVADVTHDPTWAVTQAGTAALASMSESDFQERLAALQAGRERIATIQRALMTAGEDYGLIPGTQKPTLFKPGAEKLCDFYRLAADFVPGVTYGDGLIAPSIAVVMRCQLHLGSLDGPVVGVGYGQANSWEPRYRYRRGERLCLACGKPGRVVHTKRGSWWHPQDKGGCGESVPDTDKRVAAWLAQSIEDVENPNPYELANTLVKMAEKRAHIDATLRATATSGLFTQDVEDSQEPRNVDPITGEILDMPETRGKTLRDIAEAAADAAEGSQEPPEAETASLGLSDPNEAPGGSQAATGLSLREFNGLAKTTRIATVTVAETAKRIFPKAESVGSLTNDEREQLWDIIAIEAAERAEA